jgi:hypothetical protein
MMSRGIALLLFLFVPLELVAQRYGRPDSAQNYGRVKNPHLFLQVKVQKKRSYFGSSDLKKMKRVRVTFVDPVTGASHLYEGVPLSTFLPQGILDTASAVIEVSLDSHRSVTIPSVDLDPSVEPIVVDTVDGKKLTGYVPYYFLAKKQQENAELNKDVKLITIIR